MPGAGVALGNQACQAEVDVLDGGQAQARHLGEVFDHCLAQETDSREPQAYVCHGSSTRLTNPTGLISAIVWVLGYRAYCPGARRSKPEYVARVRDAVFEVPALLVLELVRQGA